MIGLLATSLVLAIVVLVVASSRRVPKFDWIASNSAPAGCPMEITSGDFMSSSGESLYIPPKLLNPGWGEHVSLHVVGPDTKPLPDRMKITFYSYLEDKIYHGEFPLPYARIEKLFVEGFDSYDTGQLQHVTYDTIIAGVAPGGVVAVWVDGLDRRVEVFFGKADEVSADWHQTLGMPSHVDRREIMERTLRRAEARNPLVAKYMQDIPFGLWDEYRTRYAWRPVFEGMATPSRVERVLYFNGEREALFLPLSEAEHGATRTVPKFISFVVRRPEDGIRYEITFDEEETLAAFRRLGSDGKPLELVFHTATKARSGFSVFVRNENETVKLSKIGFEWWKVTLRIAPEPVPPDRK